MSQSQEILPVPIKLKKGKKKLAVVIVLVIVIVIIAADVLFNYSSSSNNNSNLVKTSGPVPVYDEQEIISFNGSFTALSFNLTAVAQQDSHGYGPAYLLNGLSNLGYWYQIGITYHWYSELNNTSYRDRGFSGVYEVFAPNGTSIFPAKGGGSLQMNINAGDQINLYLALLTNGSVVMKATDLKTFSSGTEFYSAFGATYFESAGGLDNSKGVFTGLMTEWYHSSPYYGNESAVTYVPYGGNIQYAWLGADEYNTSGPNRTIVFGNSTPEIDLSQYPSGYTYTDEGVTIIASPQSFTTS